MTDGSYLSINPEPIPGGDLHGDSEPETGGWDRIAFSVRASIEVARPTDLVFRIMDELELGPEVVEHTEIVPFPTGGHSCTTVSRRGSKLIRQRNTMVEYLPGERLVG